MTDDTSSKDTATADDSDPNKTRKESSGEAIIEIGKQLFEWRDYTPIPFIAILLFTASPTVVSATLGTIVAITGELLRIYGVSFIGSVSRTRNIESHGAQLVTSGPFKWMRNPLYVGNFLVTMGFVLFGGVGWVIAITGFAFAFQYHAIVKFEEGLLEKSFGQSFKDYCEKVPAWLPKHPPAIGDWDWPEEGFSAALKSERRTLTAIGVMLAALMLIGST